MLVLVVLFGSWMILRGIGWLGVAALATWQDTARYALAAMFVFTGISHFTQIRHDMARMIPSVFPQKMFIVYLTGVFEISGALGLLILRFRSLSGICLTLLLIAMFSANVNAALNNVTLLGNPPTPLWLRTPMQIMFIALTWWVSNPQLFLWMESGAPRPR
jgi:uncharacterized membrane protein